MRVLLVGGRSGGHIYALVAVAAHLRARDAECPLLFVGEKGRMEEDFVPRAGYELTVLDMPSASGPAWRRALSLPRWWSLYRQSAGIIKRFAPDVVLGSGGQVCLPVLLAAKRAGLPTLLLEPNAIPGWANRLTAKYARPDIVGLLLPEAADKWPTGQRIEMTGYPLRPEILDTTRAEGLAALGLDPARRTLLVFGGSQGSGHLNDVLTAWLATCDAAWADGWQVLHLGGWINAKGFDSDQRPRLPYHYLPYLHEMEQALAAADLVLGRAGATSMAELTALGLPAVLVPLAGVADNHQVHNTRWMAQAGAAEVIGDSELTPQRLGQVLDSLCGDPARLVAMADASAALGTPDSAERVVALLDELAEGRRS